MELENGHAISRALQYARLGECTPLVDTIAIGPKGGRIYAQAVNASQTVTDVFLVLERREDGRRIVIKEIMGRGMSKDIPPGNYAPEVLMSWTEWSGRPARVTVFIKWRNK